MVRMAQTMHLSCTDTTTISKWIEMRFHMTHAYRSSIRCGQNDLQAYGTFGANHSCRTRFSKEQNQANHMCAQEVHTYARMKKYQKQCYYIPYT
jgi:hypothetical protein